MTRTAAREIAVQMAYELGFHSEPAREFVQEKLTPEYFASMADGEDLTLYREFPNEKIRQYICDLVTGVGEHGYELDSYIEQYAIGWRFDRIPRVATAIMRVAMYELLYMPDVPPKVAINEAVEIAKHYEDEKVVSFLNGILGSFYQAEIAPPDAEKQ